MGNDEGLTAHEFIKKKLKELKKTQSDLTQELVDDRVTYYRRLKNELPITDDFKERISNALNLSPQEREELERLLKAVQFGEATVSLWKMINDTLFNMTAMDAVDFFIQKYDGEGRRYRAGLLFEHIFSDSDEPGFQYEMTVINCVSQPASQKLAKMLASLKPFISKGTVRHWVDFCGTDDASNFETLSSLVFKLPLVQIRDYFVYFRYVKDSSKKTLFDNSVVLSVAHGTRQKDRENYWLTFSAYGDSDCITLSDDMYSYIKQQYENYGLEFNTLLLRSYSDETAMRDLYNICKDEPEAVLAMKSDPGYGVIPPAAYDALKARALPNLDASSMVFFANAMPRLSLEDAVDYFIDFQKKRYELTRAKTYIDVHSVNGLTKFARTGLLSDQVEGVPPFNGNETALILEDMYDRSHDTKDPYQLYITRGDLLGGKYFINVTKNGRVYIELLYTRNERRFKSASIEHQALSGLFFQYLENWLIPSYTMAPTDSDKFMRRLIMEARDRDEK